MTLRLLTDPPLDGPMNMARDEAVLEAVAARAAPATLRLYAWSPATISLGYFQEYAEYERLAAPAGGLAVVRRTTGGGAILHDLELTYSMVLPADHHWVSGGAGRLYEIVHRAIIRAIGGAARLAGGDGEAGACDASAQRGPFFCFARRHALDVVVPCGPWSGLVGASCTRDQPEFVLKIAGSAQRRTARAVLQHGSLILDSRFDQHPCATWSSLGGPREFADACERLIAAVRATHQIDIESGTWSPAELARAGELLAKYAGGEWTRRR